MEVVLLFRYTSALTRSRRHDISKFVPDGSGQISPRLARYAVARPDEVHPA